MRIKKWALFIILTGTLIFFATDSFSKPKETHEISIGTHAVGSMYSVIGAGLADLINKYTDLKCRVKPLAGPTAWLPMLKNAEVTFGLMNTRDCKLAWDGVKVYKDLSNGKGFRFLRFVSRGSYNLYGLVIRADSGIETAADLKGKRTAWGHPSHFMVQDGIEAMYTSLGVSFDDLKKVLVSTYPAGVNAFKEGRVDCCLGSFGSGAIRAANTTVGGLRFLPLGGSPEAKKRLADQYSGWDVVRAPKDNIGVKKDDFCLAVSVGLVTGNNISEEIVYKVTKAVYENYKELEKVHPVLKTWTAKRMIWESPVFDYHKGATRFYKEKGVWKE
jgi:TRAP transporter TAXI family solute receptor